MSRISQKPLKQQWFTSLQDGRCLLCKFPLPLGCHLHHIISFDDGGPDHPLNFVALCPNCHLVLESVKRHIAPQESNRKDNWLLKARSALAYLQTIPEAARRLFDRLAEPHKYRREIRKGVPDDLRVAFAKDLAREDARILLAVHREFPALVQSWRNGHSTAHSNSNESPQVADIAEVIELHLHGLGLPFDLLWLPEIA